MRAAVVPNRCRIILVYANSQENVNAFLNYSAVSKLTYIFSVPVEAV